MQLLLKRQGVVTSNGPVELFAIGIKMQSRDQGDKMCCIKGSRPLQQANKASSQENNS